MATRPQPDPSPPRWPGEVELLTLPVFSPPNPAVHRSPFSSWRRVPNPSGIWNPPLRVGARQWGGGVGGRELSLTTQEMVRGREEWSQDWPQTQLDLAAPSRERAGISRRVWNPLQRVGRDAGKGGWRKDKRVNLPVTRRRKWEPEDSRTRLLRPTDRRGLNPASASRGRGWERGCL